MEGRWKRCVALGILAGLVGCNRSQLVPPSPPAPTVTKKPAEPQAKDGPLAVDTLVKLGNVHLAAAQDGNHSASERQNLMSMAKNEYQQALQREPKNMEAFGGLAQLCVANGDKEKALEVYRQAAKAAPKNSDVYVAMALCCKQFDDRDGAVEYLHEATKLNPTDRRLKINLGFELAMAGRYEEGLAWLRSTMGETQGHFAMAQVYDHQGKKELAQQELRIVLQSNPNYHPAHELLARLSGEAQPASPGGEGVRTVGYETSAAIPDSRLAPNARLISQPDPRPVIDAQPGTERKIAPAASMQPPEPIPTTPPKSLPPVLQSSGWDH